jgi:predicted O-methyltransferase YrrM
MAFTPTNMKDWIRSDAYHNRFLIPPDGVLTAALTLSEQNGLPSYAVSEAQGKFLNLLAKSIQARRILEIGTLGGYDITFAHSSHVLYCIDIPRFGWLKHFLQMVNL